MDTTQAGRQNPSTHRSPSHSPPLQQVAVMGSEAARAHVVVVPYPAQGHVAPLLQLARLLHGRGAHVTLVHTRFYYARLLRAKGEAAVHGSASASCDGFRFRVEVIDDGLSLSVPQHDVAALVDAVRRNCLDPFRALLRRLQQVTCVVADVVMTFAPAAAREAGIPEAQFFTASACGLIGYSQYDQLIKRGLVPIKDASCLTNGGEYLDTPLDWVPGMPHMRFRDMPAFCRTTDPDDVMVAVTLEQMRSAAGSSAIILNTLYELEKDVVDALAASFVPPIYTVGPLAQLLASSSSSAPCTDEDNTTGLGPIDISIWEEDTRCLSWLDGKKSVVYVNFGSVAVMTSSQTREFALGLAACGFPFLWVKRPDVVDNNAGEEVAHYLPHAFNDAVAKGNGLVVPWCAQAAVLRHAAVGLFVTHCGWNSLLEAAVAGLPVLGWPVFAEQTTNCRQVCEVWGNGAELPDQVESAAVARMVREMMEGELGREKREKAAEWKAKAEAATGKDGSSWRNVERLLQDLLFATTK
ncbi:hypothetical protein PR202_gb12865 [Eleusine coracana subsp. coracana]|uniref:Glycosyltransferase n=1 Tax=Eleusine coracana subsp. coracana TaxID=191504 RepID=A0AAV5ES89_ELECO|nr:hypothetical protein QOZ80_7BG0595730 [Eleusine coracana subsp. coracana]GJN25080.1 hypothetical protein PR202_gb12865 [Eleusine coracana subsp. coracana]